MVIFTAQRRREYFAKMIWKYNIIIFFLFLMIIIGYNQGVRLCYHRERDATAF